MKQIRFLRMIVCAAMVVMIISTSAYAACDPGHSIFVKSDISTAEKCVFDMFGDTVSTELTGTSPRLMASGGVDDPSAPAYWTIDSREGKLPVTINPDTKNASVIINEDLGSSITGGAKEAIALIDAPDDVTSFTFVIDAAYLSNASSKGTLTVITRRGVVEIPADLFANIRGVDGRSVLVTIGAGDKSGLSGTARNDVGNRPLAEISMMLEDGSIKWNDVGGMVNIFILYEPTTAEMANNESVVMRYIDDKGNAVCIPNGHYDTRTGTVTCNTTQLGKYAVGYNPVTFKDTDKNAWYGKAVSFIAARGITTGTGNGNYSPNARLTRGEFIVLMMRAYCIDPDTDPKDNFVDAGNTYYTGYLAAAKRLGISAGVGNNQYAPNKEITRQEMFALLYNTLNTIDQLPQGNSGKALSSFADAGQVSSWARDAMKLLVETGTVSGSGNMLKPLSTTTRAEMAQVLYNLLGR